MSTRRDDSADVPDDLEDIVKRIESLQQILGRPRTEHKDGGGGGGSLRPPTEAADGQAQPLPQRAHAAPVDRRNELGQLVVRGRALVPDGGAMHADRRKRIVTRVMPSPRVTSAGSAQSPHHADAETGDVNTAAAANRRSAAEHIDGDCEGNETLELLQQVTYMRVCIDCIHWRAQPAFAASDRSKGVGLAERGQYFVEYQIPCADKALESLGKKNKVPSKRELSTSSVTTFGHRRVALVKMSSTLYELWSRAALTFRIFYQPPRLSPRDRTGPNMMRPVGRCSVRLSDILQLPFGVDVDVPLEQLSDAAAGGTMKVEVQLGSRNSAFQGRVHSALAQGHRKFSSSSDDVSHLHEATDDGGVRVAPARSHSQAELGRRRNSPGRTDACDTQVRVVPSRTGGTRAHSYDMKWPNNPAPVQRTAPPPHRQTAIIQTPSFVDGGQHHGGVALQPRIDLGRRRRRPEHNAHVQQQVQQSQRRRPTDAMHQYADYYRHTDEHDNDVHPADAAHAYGDETRQHPHAYRRAESPPAPVDQRRVTIADREQVFYRSASVSESDSADRTGTVVQPDTADRATADRRHDYAYYMPQTDGDEPPQRHDRAPSHANGNQSQYVQERRQPAQRVLSNRVLRVTVHSAKHLPLVKGAGGAAALPNVFVTMRGDNDDVLRSNIANQTADPMWHWSKVINVPMQRKNIVLKLWHRPTDGCRDRVLGFVSLDVPLAAERMPSTQYYDVIDLSQTGAGRVKVTMSAERDASIGECRRSTSSDNNNMLMETSFAEPQQRPADVEQRHPAAHIVYDGEDRRRNMLDERRIYERNTAALADHGTGVTAARAPKRLVDRSAGTEPAPRSATATDEKATNTTASLHCRQLRVDTGIKTASVPRRSPFMDDYYNTASKSFLADKLRNNMAELDDMLQRIVH